MARSECEHDFKFYRSKLADTRPQSAEYLDGIPRVHVPLTPCLDGTYLIRFTDGSNRPDHVHLRRSVNLMEKECTYRSWQDQRYRKTYFYQFEPVVRSVTIARHSKLKVPTIIVEDKDRGSRGRKPGPKPSHKRKQRRPGSVTSAPPTIAMTQ
ncbi:hypothetical protein PHMEG_00026338 [Phytophthora megakarya]|uniref:Uncharacterized protein n=1 Tax=Phytophthora megakarya TaxID=4795 RepID=A0A225VCD9_9STRA|nr:hypothetical protein PHMEG_00026338 [Phytophthora megakarya]